MYKQKLLRMMRGLQNNGAQSILDNAIGLDNAAIREGATMRQVVRSISLSKRQLWLKTNKKQMFGQVVFKPVLRAKDVKQS